MSPLHYLSSRSDFDFEFVEIFVIEKRKTRRVGESTRFSIELPFFPYKLLNKSIVIVHYIPGFFLPNWSFKGLVKLFIVL
jgi:hypothetical protein